MLWGAPLAAQRGPVPFPAIVASGRVIRIGAADSAPAAGVRVVLHYLGRSRRAPLDSVLTDAAGRFRFRFPADTTALHIVTARHAGIQYFAEPLSANPSRPDTAVVLVVHDTSSAAPVSLEARHIVLSAPAGDGSRSVVELLSIRNDGPLARVSPDSAAATWSMRIPARAIGFAVSDGDLSAGAVDRSDDSVLVRGPIAPGARQVSVEYLLPAGIDAAEFPVDAPTTTVNVLVEESGARMVTEGLPADSATVIQGRSFQRWTGAMAAGSRVRIELPRPFQASRWLMAVLVVSFGLVLLAAAWIALRQPHTLAQREPAS